ncbi:MAG: hypothetical protein QXI93_05405, partial [Candidatus Methanomethylicia archaeon]
AIPTENVELDLKYIVGMEKSIIGALNPATTTHIDRTINVAKKIISDLRRIVTHEYCLDEINKAMETMEKRIGDPIKIILKAC